MQLIYLIMEMVKDQEDNSWFFLNYNILCYTLVYTFVIYNEGKKSFSFSNGATGVSPAFRLA